jgi:hypothetical protein
MCRFERRANTRTSDPRRSIDALKLFINPYFT